MKMRLMLLPSILLALTACGAGPLPKTPDAQLADEIDAKLSKVPCIGPMSRWERHYSFSSDRSPVAAIVTLGWSYPWYDYNSVDISFRQAGFEEFRSRRLLEHGTKPISIDDRNYNLVFGHYDIPTHTAYIWACGPNVGGADVDPSEPRIIVH